VVQIIEELGDGVLFREGRDYLWLGPPKLYADDSGFAQHLSVSARSFHGALEVSTYSRPSDMAGFVRELTVVYDTLEGTACLPNTYDGLKLGVRGDGLGHIFVEVQLGSGSPGEPKLAFELQLEQTQLPKIIRDFDRLFVKADTARPR